MTAPQIVWFRRDLRLADHPALCAAASAGPVIPVYVLDDETTGDRKMGGASRWWLHHSLASLDKSLGRHRSRLVLRRGDAAKELAKLAKEVGAGAVHAIRHYEPWWRKAQGALGKEVDLGLYDGNYLLPPGTVTTGSGDPYKIYTPFAKAARQCLPAREVLDEPSFSNPDTWPKSDKLDDWDLLPTKPDWAGGFRKAWDVGESAAMAQIDDFADRVKDYEGDRNMPSIDGSSRLSPHLHFGEISPTQVWDRLARHSGQGADTYRGELLWRDYAQTIICQFPAYPSESYRDYDPSLWRNPNRGHVIAEELAAWQQGRTGYPIVDAGMRQLWATGWMHNRVRMIAASFLVKHLLIDWRHGEQWFWDTLVDADYGNNGVNWQWISGTGVDSNMFVRIMAPLTQSEKFDAGDYIREWVPELADLPDAQIHDPDDRHRPDDYADKIIGHKEARERALAAYREMKA
ncbi:cryptochrome/photolyase family protein [Croceicoccus naphthovorans]|uniref:Deoxyribodipyrimidine photolyase n=1 Tax=Croceicoccus naphthovorans TaxID=1348774 RepID=A0A0G3XJ95_9SPHN|nr:deoxyribodipyrimidine photo-lyase [Croceicoccus naphthovorans]AKM10458.1 deoxyribodipyrimidine photolyase [Croceicoccus naphthovorans]MBB3988629.1 deoxyribodipyrimidine photo-lyase [Croceicoccus naphthovorans]